MFVPGKPFQPSLMFAGKARAYPIEAHFRCYTVGQVPGLSHKHPTRLERLARDKHSSLLQKSVNCGVNFLQDWPQVYMFTKVI